MITFNYSTLFSDNNCTYFIFLFRKLNINYRSDIIISYRFDEPTSCKFM